MSWGVLSVFKVFGFMVFLLCKDLGLLIMMGHLLFVLYRTLSFRVWA